VHLWERSDELGGAMRIAAMTPMHRSFPRFIEFQKHRLDNAGVDVAYGKEATPAAIVDFEPDVVVLATGADPRTPRLEGVDLPHVHQMDDVIRGDARVAGKVVVLAQNDGMQPLAVADMIAAQGDTKVVLVYPSLAPAQSVGKYVIGVALERLIKAGAEFVTMRRATRITATSLETVDIFAGTPLTIDDVDAVVLACGRVPDTSLRRAIQGQVPDVHVLGDAYAPQRITFATRQAWALANQL
jgi:pyruvate/2-oxoglutarate dehydrogenase complex dihydrolipoamide dehydrogenase (E3) component